jgi:hypothetical protein
MAPRSMRVIRAVGTAPRDAIFGTVPKQAYF